MPSPPCPAGLLRLQPTEESFLQDLLRDTLDWPLPTGVRSLEEIGRPWGLDEFAAAEFGRVLTHERIWQIPALDPTQPFLLFVIEIDWSGPVFARRSIARLLRTIVRSFRNSSRSANPLLGWDPARLVFLLASDWRHYGLVCPTGAWNRNEPELAAWSWTSPRFPKDYWRSHLVHALWPAPIDDWYSCWSPLLRDIEEVIDEDIAVVQYEVARERRRLAREWSPTRRKGPKAYQDIYDPSPFLRRPVSVRDGELNRAEEMRGYLRSVDERIGSRLHWEGWTEDLADEVPSLFAVDYGRNRVSPLGDMGI